MTLILILAGTQTSKIVAFRAQKINPHAYIENPTRPKRNCGICGTENPTQPNRVTVWCGFSSRGIIGPFFFENKQGEATFFKFHLVALQVNKSHLLYRVLSALSIYTGHQMQCPPPLESASYLEQNIPPFQRAKHF